MPKSFPPRPGDIVDPVFPKAPPRGWPGKKLMLFIALLLLVLGFFAGRGFQHLANGYTFQVRDEKSYPFQEGTLRWRYATECIGIPFLDSGTTQMEFLPPGGLPITLYKAKVGFQEGVPFATNIQTSGNTITWDDEEFRYALEVQKMTPPPEDSTPPDAPAPTTAP